MRTSGRDGDIGNVVLTVAVLLGVMFLLFDGPRPFLYALDGWLRDGMAAVMRLFR